jgi:crossover junction endodeoxyribonuclease RusA
VQAAKLQQHGLGPLFGCTDRLRVELSVTPPDNRRRDLDNLLKATLDAMQIAGVYYDDSQIDELLVIRRPVRKGEGELIVSLSAISV